MTDTSSRLPSIPEERMLQPYLVCSGEPVREMTTEDLGALIKLIGSEHPIIHGWRRILAELLCPPDVASLHARIDELEQLLDKGSNGAQADLLHDRDDIKKTLQHERSVHQHHMDKANERAAGWEAKTHELEETLKLTNAARAEGVREFDKLRRELDFERSSIAHPLPSSVAQVIFKCCQPVSGHPAGPVVVRMETKPDGESWIVSESTMIDPGAQPLTVHHNHFEPRLRDAVHSPTVDPKI